MEWGNWCRWHREIQGCSQAIDIGSSSYWNMEPCHMCIHVSYFYQKCKQLKHIPICMVSKLFFCKCTIKMTLKMRLMSLVFTPKVLAKGKYQNVILQFHIPSTSFANAPLEWATWNHHKLARHNESHKKFALIHHCCLDNYIWRFMITTTSNLVKE